MRLTDRSFTDLLAAFRSSDATPGGGSASALAGAVGAALLAMVAGLPKPRATGESDLERLRTAGARCTELSHRLNTLVDRDSEAYDVVMSAYRLPKATDDEKASRSARIQDALRVATETPLDVMRACRNAVEQVAAVKQLGNRNAWSDVQVALELLSAGLRGAKVNVEINLDGVKDQAYATQARNEADRLLIEFEKQAASARAELADD